MKRSPELELEEDTIIKKQKTDDNSDLSLGESMNLSD
jgi:hypothetical protein